MINVVIHISDSGWGNAVAIDSWHRQKGWSMIGYHFVILNGQIAPRRHISYFDGQVETGRPCDLDNVISPDEVGAHTLGYNQNSIGICLIALPGRITDAQLRSLKSIIQLIKTKIPEVQIYQHSDLDPVNRPYCASLTKSQMEVLKFI
jgi:N-acetylmuramoyl-L-alanine amidase